MENLGVSTSIDRISIVAYDAGMQDVVNRTLVLINQRTAPHPYKWRWDIVGGGVLEYADGTNVLPWRIDVNPTKNKAWIELLQGLKYPRITRIDFAVDYHGYDLSGVVWLTKNAMKRNWWTGLDGRLETLYIGAARSALRFRIYDKHKEREQDEEMAAAPDAREGGTREPGGCPTCTGAAPDCSPWWRVEAQVRPVMEGVEWSNPFTGLQGFVELVQVRSWEDEAVAHYIRTFPGAWGRMPKNTRMRWKKRIRAEGVPLAPQPAEVWERDKGLLRAQWEAWVEMMAKGFVSTTA